MEIKTRISNIHHRKKGEAVSYGKALTLERDSIIGIAPVGYADGYPWNSFPEGKVIIDNQFCNLIGRVTMDQILFDITDVNAEVNDEVVILGSSEDGKSNISVFDIAEWNKTIEWERFQQPSPNKLPWGNGKEALERFFRWRCWFDYGTGLSGDLLSHDFDTINQIMDIGIPKYASSTGGVYFYKDGRDVPDVWHATLEYPDKDLTLLYSASLSSSNPRGNRIMGHDATMQMGGQSGGGSIHGFIVTADELSTQYKDRLENGIINPGYPIYTYSPGSKQIDGVTSATSRYFAQKGLLYTYREGKRVDPTHLHVKDWIDSIRDGSQPKCNIEVAFHEGVACAMATESYLKGRRIEWDPKNRRLV